MGFLTSLLGSENPYVTAALALGVVIILIILGVWLLKVIADASRRAGRGRSRRLGVIDSVPLDQRRQAILLRRDNVEHLIITGGPQDVVVETGIEPPSTTPRPAARAPEPRLGEPPITPRPRPVAMTRQRPALRGGAARPAGEAAITGEYTQNGLRAHPDSANAEHLYGEGEHGAAGYETADMGEGERDHYPGEPERRDER